MPLYHRDIGFPCTVILPRGVFRLRYTQHALRECNRDRYGAFEPPDTLDVTAGTPIEIELCNGRVVKAVYRAQFDDEFDVVLVINPDGLVRTAWLNRRDDHHRTLDRAKYAQF